MKYAEILAQNRDAMTAKRVFGEPTESGGVTVIPVASVGGGGGGGGGGPSEGEQGEGVGFGFGAKPVGAYVLKDGKVDWRPAVDVNALISAIARVLVVALITRLVIQRKRLVMQAWAETEVAKNGAAQAESP
ncbi:spore germination protein GerW family protein [Nocardia terrae]|uniref:spore germination protein GerW family protein n=1 Tax=Nocardia terrae TaxID=2675851 RepID=UPI001F2DC411|nr:spore germination protein GerW family protein [Nocardia terrae]